MVAFTSTETENKNSQGLKWDLASGTVCTHHWHKRFEITRCWMNLSKSPFFSHLPYILFLFMRLFKIINIFWQGEPSPAQRKHWLQVSYFFYLLYKYESDCVWVTVTVKTIIFLSASGLFSSDVSFFIFTAMICPCRVAKHKSLWMWELVKIN